MSLFTLSFGGPGGLTHFPILVVYPGNLLPWLIAILLSFLEKDNILYK